MDLKGVDNDRQVISTAQPVSVPVRGNGFESSAAGIVEGVDLLSFPSP